MTRQRLDAVMVDRGIVATRSQANSMIRLGNVCVNGNMIKKSGSMVAQNASIELVSREQYVSRAGLKLASVADLLGVSFDDKTVLDVGSSTGGFTDYALQHGANKVIAVDVGSDQLHPSLRADERIELHEKTDIRDFTPLAAPDIVVIDVSFVSLKKILPHIFTICDDKTNIIAMVKPQFEARRKDITKTGIIKNDRVRRTILKEFEQWVKSEALIIEKADSDVAGKHGNKERFYLLRRRRRE